MWECCEWMITTPVSYLRGPGFGSQPLDWLSCLRFLDVSRYFLSVGHSATRPFPNIVFKYPVALIYHLFHTMYFRLQCNLLCPLSNGHIVQCNSFNELETPDDGRVQPKHDVLGQLLSYIVCWNMLYEIKAFLCFSFLPKLFLPFVAQLSKPVVPILILILIFLFSFSLLVSYSELFGTDPCSFLICVHILLCYILITFQGM
jgi:hypothetical protein